MNFRKFATLLLFAMLVIGFSKNSVLAAAQDSADVSIVATKEAVQSNSSSKKSSGKSYTRSELRLMASIINCEAGSESYQGKLAVGIVIMNRKGSKKFPSTLRGVIYQKGQFSPVRNGTLKKRLAQYDAGKTNGKQWKGCIRAAKRVLKGNTTITYRGKKKNMKGFYFFSQTLAGARFRLGGHRFK